MPANYNSDFELLKCNLKRFIQACNQAQNQKTTKGLKLKEISGTFQGFKLKASFGSGNLTSRPALAFLKDNNTMPQGIYPIIVYLPKKNEIIVCKGVSYDRKSPIEWLQITEEDNPMPNTIYAHEKGKFSYVRNFYQLDEIDNNDTIHKIQNDLISIIEDYPRSK